LYKYRAITTKLKIALLIIILFTSSLLVVFFRSEFMGKAPEEEKPPSERPPEKPPEKPPEEKPPEKPPEERPPEEKPPPPGKLSITVSYTPPEQPPNPDLDGDGLSNEEELAYGLDPLNPDTDGDGILDGAELAWNIDTDGDGTINALDSDSDGDGILDGVEDKDQDGVVGKYETDPTDPDTDDDGLNDGEEDFDGDGVIDLGEPDPLNPDTDGDGVKDGYEPDWYSDTDGDGSINVLDSDSDDDGLKDGEELVRKTDPLTQDTDGDGLMDGLEVDKGVNPLSKDTDNDGLKDGEEAVIDAYWVEAEDLALQASQVLLDMKAVNNKTLAPTESGLLISANPFRDLPSGMYKLYIRTMANYSAIGHPAIEVLVTADGETLTYEIHPLTYIIDQGMVKNIYRWISTDYFYVPEDATPSIILDSPRTDVVLVDRMLLVRVDSFDTPLTDPLNPDTDGDGILDGAELITKSYWLEAEDFLYDESQLLEDPDSSSGLAILPTLKTYDDGTQEIIYALIGNLTLGRGPYNIFIRSSVYDPFRATQIPGVIDVEITVEYENRTETILGQSDVPWQYRRGRWNQVYFGRDRSSTTFWLNDQATLGIKLWMNVSAHQQASMAFIDRVALIHMRYDRTWPQLYYDYDPIPRCLDPLDPDTDGDEYRFTDGALANSTGYLTDGFEWKLGMNPFDIDTDNDGLMGWNATIPATDDVDPNPLSWDSDRDGIFDWIEDENGNGIWDERFGETDYLDADTDNDGIIDGNENRNYKGWDVYETDPLNPDSDFDGLLDGIEVGLKAPQRPEDTEGWPQRNMTSPLKITDPLDWDTDDDGLPDGWMDFNDNGEKDLGEFEDRNLDGITALGDWNPAGGGETDPTDPDTDDDGLDDYYEVMNGLDPLSTQPFDLSLDLVQVKPVEPIIRRGEAWTTVNLEVLITNHGPGKLPSQSRGIPLAIGFNITVLRNGVKVWSGFPLSKLELDANGSSVAKVYNLRLKPGRYEVTLDMSVMLLTEKGPIAFNGEINPDNNLASVSFSVKAYPKAYMKLVDIKEGLGYFNVTFAFWGEDEDSDKLLYQWDLDGDGEADWSAEVFKSNGLFTNLTLTGKFNETGTHKPVFKVSDEDGLEDVKEKVFTLWHIGEGDFDGDGLSSEEEAKLGTDPEKFDTDGDGLRDGLEVEIGSDPLKQDSDQDGLSDALEMSLMIALGMDPATKPDSDNDTWINILDVNSDNDGLSDGKEVICLFPDKAYDPESWSGTNPYVNDTDLDGISDGEERFLGLDPLSPDTDGDGLSDSDELLYGTKPLLADTDGDGIGDSMDLQPLSGKIEPYVGEYPVIARWLNPNLVKFNSPVFVYWIKGKAYRNDGMGWYGISSENVKSREPKTEDILSYDWGSYRALNAVQKDEFIKDKVEGVVDTVPPYYKVKYDVYERRYDVTFINKERVTYGDFWGGTLYVKLNEGYNESMIIQFRLNEFVDAFVEKDRYLLPGFIYKVYEDNTYEEKGPIHTSIIPAVKLEGRVFQVELPLPNDLPYVYIYLSPVRISKYGEETDISPINGDAITYGGLVKKVQISQNEELLYGLEGFEDLGYNIPDGWLNLDSYDKSKVNHAYALEYREGSYILKEFTNLEGVHITEGKALYRYLKTEVDLLYATEDLEAYLDEVKSRLGTERVEDVKGGIEDFVDGIEALKLFSKDKDVSLQQMGAYLLTYIAKKEATTVISSKSQILGKLMRLYDPMKRAYREIKQLRTLYKDFKQFYDKVRAAKQVAGKVRGLGGITFMKKVIEVRKTALTSPIKSRSFYTAIAIGVVEISINLYMAGTTSDTFMKSYYLAQATVAGIFLAVAVALYFIPGGQVVGVILTVILLIPGVQEKLEEFTQWLSEGWMEILGEVPTSFAIDMFNKACKRVQRLAEEAINRDKVAILIMPQWK
jgi:hypothetical protein